MRDAQLLLNRSTSEWSPVSWRGRVVDQPVNWPDGSRPGDAIRHLAQLPPLVEPDQVDRLRHGLADVQEGRAFALFAGDCAESFDELSADRVVNQVKLILQMSLVLTFAAGVPVIKVGRMAGQFAKPRSSPTEERHGTELPAFRGHLVNSEFFDRAARAPDPDRLLRGYRHSAAVLALVRDFTSSGLANLGRAHRWNLDFVQASPQGRRYEELAGSIDKALCFVAACGHPVDNDPAEVFTAHEALVLDYDGPLTRFDATKKAWYGCSAHYLWIGDRTRQLTGAHIEYASGISNPIGVKVGPDCVAEELVALCRRLNPRRVAGRLSLVIRMGANRLRERLPNLIEAVVASGEKVVWICDPMHANTRTVQWTKTRDVADVTAEIEAFFEIHRVLGTWPGGLHLELTPEDVTECTGGSWPITEDVLARNYLSLCDPRLNGRQALDVTFQTADLMNRA